MFYSILPEYCPVLLELQVHGETIEKQASSETEKRRRKVTTPKLGILGDAVWKVTSRSYELTLVCHKLTSGLKLTYTLLN